MSFIREIFQPRHAGIALSILALAACGGGSDTAKRPPQLHLACQTVECECRAGKESLFGDRKTTEIVWRLNGDATCPAGFVLERVQVDFRGRRR
ncbi:MAG: hypothetical protein EBU57_03560 [Alphaproteobacteria bacterium]|nr:hypothetical protein [Alphaproteobacteria bacterium]